MSEGQPQEFLHSQAERGHNTAVHFTFLRHSQKANANVFNQDGGISAAAISTGGQERAKQLGKKRFAGRDIDKSYGTKVTRTRETLAAAFGAAGVDPVFLEKSDATEAYFALPAQAGSKAYNKRYDDIMEPHRQTYITEHFPGKKFAELPPDEQEIVAEYAEEPAMEWYLAHNSERPDAETPSPREDAARVAYKINHLVNVVDYMPGGKEVDLVSSGHKTSTEAFLKYVIERQVGDKTIVGFNTLSDIGGSLKILDGWDLDVKNNERGEKTATIILRRENGDTQAFGLNLKKLHELAAEYMAANKLPTKKIDTGK